MTVLDGDTGPTANPRAQLEPPYQMGEGSTAWLGWGLYLPEDFPLPYPNGWCSFAQVYGPPYAGSPPWGIGLEARTSRLVLSRNDNSPTPWTMPALKSNWMDFAVKIKLSSNPKVGYIELHVNTGSGWTQQTFRDGTQRLRFATLDASNKGGPNTFDLHLYRQQGRVDSLTAYFATHKVGRSRDDVDPRSYPTA